MSHPAVMIEESPLHVSHLVVFVITQLKKTFRRCDQHGRFVNLVKTKFFMADRKSEGRASPSTLVFDNAQNDHQCAFRR